MLDKKKYLIVIGGPTASGKTSLAIQLAQHFNTVIVSADSRQFYREMSIGTAKPTSDELNAAPHYFINSLSVNDSYSVGDFEREGLELLNQLFENHKIVILTGGSGLYINAICQGLDSFPKVDPTIRKTLEEYYEKEGIEALQKEIKEVDPIYARKVDLGNPHRLIRALSVYRASGQAYSYFLKQQTTERPFEAIHLQMSWARDQLYERINQRVDLMIAQGLLEEAKALHPLKHKSALQTVGYQELFDYFDGNISQDTAIELIKRNSRRYAKRQLTWMRRDGFWKQFTPQQVPAILNYLEWIMEASIHPQTIKNKDNEDRTYGFFQDHLAFSLGNIFVRKNYVLYEVSLSADHAAARWLLHDLYLRPSTCPVFLLSPQEIEPFVLDTGFVQCEPGKALPKLVADKMGSRKCYQKHE
ncbi:MAG: tRNA (adenosine(37)-N6)-dimethylallyltransferase MiaA [Bacteroidota bacterium]